VRYNQVCALAAAQQEPSQPQSPVAQQHDSSHGLQQPASQHDDCLLRLQQPDSQHSADEISFVSAMTEGRLKAHAEPAAMTQTRNANTNFKDIIRLRLI
jgi:hypothetical protein